MAQWRRNAPPINNHNNNKGRAVPYPAYLRAYALWHPQSLNLYEVASLLRSPPLAPTSVAQYVLDAVSKEDLPFEPDRLREALKLVPPSLHWRYPRLNEKMRRAERR